MRNATITGIIAATIMIAGCGKKSPGSSATPPPAKANATSASPVTQPPELAIVTKAKRIVLPELKLDGITLPEALKRLSVAAKQNDPESKGVNFFITGPGTTAADSKITLSLNNVTLEEAMERLAKAARVRVLAQDYGFLFDQRLEKP